MCGCGVHIPCGLTDDTILGIFQTQQEINTRLADLESSAVRKNELYIDVTDDCNEVFQFQPVSVDDFVSTSFGF